MRKLFSFLLLVNLLLTSCDDGDIITLELSFGNVVEICDDDAINLVLYNIKSDPYESLTLVFPSSQSGTIFSPEISGEEVEIGINGSTVLFNYRTYDGNPENTLICQDIPGSSVTILNDYEAVSGANAKFTSTFVDDDNDGVSNEDENPDPNNDGNFDDAQDSDGDGIPDYIDADDDNDNVPTINEDPDPNGDGDLSDALDTDGDLIPDYLDNDDDGDGVLTRNEDANSNANPRDDISVNNIVRYLDVAVADVFIVTESIENSYERTISVTIQILDANLEILSIDTIEFGTYTKSIIIVSE